MLDNERRERGSVRVGLGLDLKVSAHFMNLFDAVTK